MQTNIDDLKAQIIRQWLEDISLDELIGFYAEKQEEFLNQQVDEDIINIALENGVISEDNLNEDKE